MRALFRFAATVTYMMNSRRLIVAPEAKDGQSYRQKRVQRKGSSMSALGQKQTFAAQNGMSALPPKADIRRSSCDVCFVPIADISPSRIANQGINEGRCSFLKLLAAVSSALHHCKSSREGYNDTSKSICIDRWQLAKTRLGP